MASSRKKKEKSKKTKHYIGLKEFLFNFLSLVFMIGVGVYFGYRSLYYYSKQNQKNRVEADTLSGFIIQHTSVSVGNDAGLHQDSLGYYYKGNVQNNYVLFGNRLFRVVRILKDNTVRLISDDYVAIFPWGNQSDFTHSNVHAWLDKTDWELSGVYYKTLPKAEQYLVKMNYQMELMTGEKVVPSDVNEEGFVTLLSPSDYVLAGGKNSYLNNGKLFFLLGVSEEKENIYVDSDGSIQHCDSAEGYGIRPVFTMGANTILSGGNGTLENPYVISQGGNSNYISSYVKLGNDLWRVFYQDEKVLKLSYNGYASINGVECVFNYSQNTSFYDIMDWSGIGYYLNNTYLSSLPYQDKLLPFNSYVGEISDDKGYQISNIYNSVVTAKVGLLNVFDYMANTGLEDYFRVNTTSEVGSMQYNTTANGRLIESDVKEAKHMVPVISIASGSFKGGTGSIMDPYTLG